MKRGKLAVLSSAFASTLASATLLGLAAGAAHAQQNWPTQPIKLILPYAPGGVADIVGRVFAQKLSESLKQQVLIDNRPSAGQAVASEMVMKAEPDGYTLLWLNSGHAVSVSLFKSLPYDPVKDFAPISTIGLFGMALVVDPKSPFKTIGDLVAYAKSNPGKVNIGTTSIGSTQYIAAELFKSMAGIDAQTVPFKATPMIIAAVKAGDVQGHMEILAPLMSHVRSGNLRALGVTFDHRFAGLPDVPAIAEAGGSLQKYEATAWNALAAPAKTPRAIIDRLGKEVAAIAAMPDVRSRLIDLGVEPKSSTPEALRELLVAEIAKWREVIERAKIEKQ